MYTITYTFDDLAQKDEVMTSIHNALKGSPAYKDSEIAICEEPDDEFKFYLVIGLDNENNSGITIDYDSGEVYDENQDEYLDIDEDFDDFDEEYDEDDFDEEYDKEAGKIAKIVATKVLDSIKDFIKKNEDDKEIYCEVDTDDKERDK